MASKRIGLTKFDHGAQFYSNTAGMNDLHKLWSSEELVSYWFKHKGIDRYFAKNGITLLAKALSKSLDLELEKKLITINKKNKQYELVFSCGRKEITDRLILTAPLPQNLAILKNSGIAYPENLESIQYAKALVILFDNVTTKSKLLSNIGYYENKESSGVFSIADQQMKNNSLNTSWTITMCSQFSERSYHNNDQTIIDQAIIEIKNLIPDLLYQNIHLKKWLYSHPQKIFTEKFIQLQNESIFLAGDAFGGASIMGAVRSANALLDFFKEDKK